VCQNLNQVSNIETNTENFAVNEFNIWIWTSSVIFPLMKFDNGRALLSIYTKGITQAPY